MGMDRILDRLERGQPPLRVGELAEFAGYDPITIRKLMREGVVASVGLTGEKRIPVAEARRILVELRVLTD